MKGMKLKTLSIFLSLVLIFNIGVFGLSFALPSVNVIGNSVWDDLNSNGIQDVGEPGISGVTVNLYDENNQFIQSKNTGSSGDCTFFVANGRYRIKFDSRTFPSGYFETKRNVGNDEQYDSDGAYYYFIDINETSDFSVRLGLTNNPYNVRISHPATMLDDDGGNLGTLSRNRIKTVYGLRYTDDNNSYYIMWYNGDYCFVNTINTDTNLIKQLNYIVQFDNPQMIYHAPTGGPIVTLPAGTKKTVYGKVNYLNGHSFYRLWFSGGPAYIRTDRVRRLDYNVRITDRTVVREYPKGPALPGNLYKNRIKTAYGYRTDNNGVMWYRVWHNGGPGYVYKLVTSRNLTSVPNFNVRTNVALSVRNEVWGTVLGTIPANTLKTVYGQRLDRDGDTWYRVWYNGGPGYIKASFTTRQ